MTVSYSWKITGLEYFPQKDGFEKVVNKIYWILIGNEDNYGSSVSAIETLQIDSLDSNKYTLYENLTEQQVLDWLIASLGPDKIQYYQNEVANRINFAKLPTTVLSDPPWA